MSILDNSAAAGSGFLDPIAAKIKNPFSATVPNNGERPADFPDGFQIIEFKDGGIAAPLKFVGNLMPMQPFPWEGEQRIASEYYPGNPEPSVQIFGPKEGNVTFHGRFKDKRYRDNSYYGVSYQYALATQQIRQRGNLVKFGMNGTAGSWWRYGYLIKSTFKMNKLSWIDYEIEFFVVGETKPQNNYFAAQEKQSPTNLNNNLINAAAAFQAKYSAVPTSVPRSIAETINGLISGVAKNINLVTGFIQTVLTTGQDIEKSAFRALGLIKNARNTLRSFNRQIDQLTHAFSTQSTSTRAATKGQDTYRNTSYYTEAMAGTLSLTLFLAQLQALFTALAKTTPKARYKVIQGDTLQNIAIKFYGASDNWTKIYDHNQLQTTVLAPGLVLEIPNL